MAELFTPDGRYLVIDGVLWRAPNPLLRAETRERLVKAASKARRDVARAKRTVDDELMRSARERVGKAKAGLGERGMPWWTDGAPDFNRRKVQSTPYAAWYAARAITEP